MATLTYRENSSPTPPGATTVKGSGLTNLEIDANFKSVDNDIQTRTTVAQAQDQAISMAIALG
jgi:hypothetical protein